MTNAYLSQNSSAMKACFLTAAIASLPALQSANSVTFPQHEKLFSSNLINSSYKIKYFDSKVEIFLDKYPILYDFISRLTLLIHEVYGKTTLNFTVWESPIDESDSHLRITLFSNLETDEEITEKENQLFELIEKDEEMLPALEYVVIAQHWKNV